jgi:hypothetical protein
MRNLYTYRLSRDEIRGLMQHYKLIGVEWAEIFEKEMEGKNDEALVYPKYRAPVVIVRDGERELDHMGRGMPAPLPPIIPGEKPTRPGFLTNVRNTQSGRWKAWLASPAVTIGRDRNQGGRCIVRAWQHEWASTRRRRWPPSSMTAARWCISMRRRQLGQKEAGAADGGPGRPIQPHVGDFPRWHTAPRSPVERAITSAAANRVGSVGNLLHAQALALDRVRVGRLSSPPANPLPKRETPPRPKAAHRQ